MTTGIVLAGGESKRMGKDKAFLKLKGKTFLRHVLETLDKHCDQIIISGNKEKDLYLQETKGLKSEIIFVKDIKPYEGPLNGIVSCLEYIKSNDVFIATCDTPLLKSELIPFLKRELNGFDAVIPVINGKFQPLNTVYKKSAIIKGKEAFHEKGTKSLYKWIELLKYKRIFEDKLLSIDPDMFSYMSVNTPEIFEKVKRIAGEC
ncbi:molybdenum cofactor guanylyltransferase [Persephonella sp.]